LKKLETGKRSNSAILRPMRKKGHATGGGVPCLGTNIKEQGARGQCYHSGLAGEHRKEGDDGVMICIDRMQDGPVQMTSRKESRRVRVAQDQLGGRRIIYSKRQGRTAVMRCTARLRGSAAEAPGPSCRLPSGR
jgi:hypothetical protein